MNFCERIITNILIVFNFFVAITGLALVGIGTYAQLHAKTYLNFLGDQYTSIPIFIIVLGVVIFVIAFFGCCGANQKNGCMLRTYAAILIIICLVEIGAGIACYVLKGVLKDELITNMKKGINNFNVTGYGGVTQTWDLMQHELSCCGVEGKQDWVESTYGKIPSSCCAGGVEGCEDTTKYEKGCLQIIEHQLRSNIAIVGGIAIGICAVQLFGIVFACIIKKTNSGENLFV